MKKLIICSALAVGLFLAPAAFAAGDSSDSDNNTSATSPKKLKCKKNEVIKDVVVDGKKEKKCVVASTGIIPDEELYQQAKLLAKEGEYDWALTILGLIENQNDPRVLNYTGYSHRKAGRLETGIAYYQKALAIDPNFNLAREYLGEGYVAAGMIKEAKMQLAEIATRCGTSCEEYNDLKKVIETAIN